MGRSKNSRPIKRQRQDGLVVSGTTGAAESTATGLPDVRNIERRSEDDQQNHHHQQQQQQRRQQQAIAIEALKFLPQDQVEIAAAEATRTTISGWPEITNQSKLPSWLRGLGVSTKIGEKDLVCLRELHDTILRSVPTDELSSWSGSPQDPRRRAFGVVPGTLGHTLLYSQNNSSSSNHGSSIVLDISRPWREQEVLQSQTDGAEDDQDELDGQTERKRNEKAIVFIQPGQLPKNMEESVENVCSIFRKCLIEQEKQLMEQKQHQHGQEQEKEFMTNYESTTSVATKASHRQPSLSELARFLHFRNLIAAQPNLHNGRELLPMHVDHPKKDGFGIIIVTIDIGGSAQILLQASSGDGGDIMSSNADNDKAHDENDYSSSLLSVTMQLHPGEAYMLADIARDACIHGVLADKDSSNRTSLNLRFGLHDIDCNIDCKREQDQEQQLDETCPCLPIVSSHQVLKHWE